MKIVHVIAVILSLYIGLSGCARPNLNTSCPDYGVHCNKVPVNGWDPQ